MIGSDVTPLLGDWIGTGGPLPFYSGCFTLVTEVDEHHTESLEIEVCNAIETSWNETE
jgi:hypothetical protein